LTSLIVATPIVLFQLKGERAGRLRRLRRLPLAIYFALKVLFYFVVIVGGLMVARYFFWTDIPDTFFAFDDVFRHSIVFAIVMSVVGTLVFEMGGLLGFGTLKNQLTGRYVQPRREQRAFLLIDLNDSTGLAERLGPERFHDLLNDFFRDVADAALECEAEIHKYVGDEAILTWRGAEALADGECLACPFVAGEAIAANSKRYLAASADAVRPAIWRDARRNRRVRREIAYVGDTRASPPAARRAGNSATAVLAAAGSRPWLPRSRDRSCRLSVAPAPLGIAAISRVFSSP
jgi:adenylate cyclase